MNRRVFSLLAALATLALCLPAQAGIIGYWRAETDNDAGGGLSIPNEVAGSPLTAPNASLSALVPVNPIPFTLEPNLFSINGNADINGTIAYYAALDTASITIEFWTRTNEARPPSSAAPQAAATRLTVRTASTCEAPGTCASPTGWTMAPAARPCR